MSISLLFYNRAYLYNCSYALTVVCIYCPPKLSSIQMQDIWNVIEL